MDDVTISDDSKWIGFRGLAADRYKRGITSENIYSDLYLVEAATGTVERLTNNAEIGESGLSFSPDSRQVAFSAPDNLDAYSMTNDRVYVRAIADRGKPFRKIGDTFDGDVGVRVLGQGRQHDLFQPRASRRPTRSCRSTCATTRCAR